jgi:uncharacterized protein (DUF433 family)
MSDGSNGSGCTVQPIIVRSAAGRYVFAGTQVDAAHVVAALPAGYDRESLKARWGELSDEHIDLAKLLGLAHAVGEGQAGGDVDEAMDEVVSSPDLAVRARDEINAWAGLKATVRQFPRSERAGLIRGAESVVAAQAPQTSLNAASESSSAWVEAEPLHPELQDLQPAVSRLHGVIDCLRRADPISWVKGAGCEYSAEPELENGVWLKIGVTERGLCYWRVSNAKRDTGGWARSLEEAAVVAEVVYWLSFQSSWSN